MPRRLRAARSQQSSIVMWSVPKKRKSKMRGRKQKANWFALAKRQAELALSRAKSAKYNPLEDPKYAFAVVGGGDAADEEEEE